ncbi:MAG: methyltransferase domain-containing protein [Nocardioides sp.]
MPSPNIWHHTATYESENRAFDPEGLVTDALRGLADWSGRDVLDIGCGTGYHLPLFAESAASVIGVEPHPALAALARRRTRRWSRVQVLEGTAQRLPLPPASVDLAHARWAYFFGPGCEPGLG